MPAFENLLRRLGFVRLGTYGLVLTPEDRIQSTRPHVLEDGLSGAPIVGWQDSDLAAAELPRWGTPKEAPRVMAPPPASLVASLSSQGLPKWVEASGDEGSPEPLAALLAAPGPVAPAAEPEDEIDWEQALARARAAADVADAPAPAPRSGLAATAFIPEPTVPGHRGARPIVAPVASSAAQTSPGKLRKDPPKTVVPIAPTKVVVPALRQPTVITSAIKPSPSPSPKLSVVPALRPTPSPVQASAKPAKKAKTAPMLAASAAATHVTRPMRAPTAEVLRSKTQPMDAAAIVDEKPVTARHRLARGTDAPANDDRTLTNIALPPAAEPTVTARAPKLAPITALPSIKQRMAGR